jgi:hypothetical protein
MVREHQTTLRFTGLCPTKAKKSETIANLRMAHVQAKGETVENGCYSSS